MTIRVRARKRLPKPKLKAAHSVAGRPVTRRVFVNGSWRDLKVWNREHLGATTRSGPALILDYGSTTLVPPGWRFRLDRSGSLLIESHRWTEPQLTVPNLRFVSKQPKDPLHDDPLRPPRWQSGHGRRRAGDARFGSPQVHAPRNCAASTTDKIIAGFAGSTADAFALFARFESKLEQHNGNLPRAVVELAKEWRTDRMLRHLEALLLVADTGNTYIVSGNGDVIEPDDDIAAIGSGGAFAKCRRHRADRKYETLRARDRRKVHGDRRQNLHLYE